MVQIFSVIHPSLSKVIFYGFAFLAPILFAAIFFARLAVTPTWISGAKLAISWMVLFYVLDGLVFLWWLEFPIQLLISWQVGLGYVAMFTVCIVAASLTNRARSSRGPEGLA